MSVGVKYNRFLLGYDYKTSPARQNRSTIIAIDQARNCGKLHRKPVLGCSVLSLLYPDGWFIAAMLSVAIYDVSINVGVIHKPP